MTDLLTLYYPTLLIISTIMFISMLVKSKDRFNLFAISTNFMMSFSIFSYYLMSISQTQEESLLAYKLFILSECIIAPGMIFYFLDICNIKFKKRYYIFAYSFSFILFILSSIKSLESIVFESLEIIKNPLIVVIFEKMGLVHTIIYIQSLFYILVGSIIALYVYSKKSRISIKNANALIICTIFDFFFYNIIKFTEFKIDFAIVRLIVQIYFVFITRRFYLYSFDTAVAKEILTNEKIGYVSFNENKCLLYVNDVAQLWFKELRKCHIDEPIGSLEGILERLINWFNRLDKSEKAIHETYTKDNLSIRIYAERFLISNNRYGYRVIMRDDSERQRYINLLNKEKSDAVIERQRVTRAMESYIDPTVINIVLNEKDNIAHSDNVAIMFADIRGFTTISETRNPEEIIDILNLTLDAMTSCVMQNKGQIDKFIGDCVMAIWSQKNEEDCCYLACKTAMDIKDAIRKLNVTLKKKYDLELSVGIGINFGNAVVGDVGSTMRRNYTVVGDAVNVSSRLEELADKDEVLVSKEVIKDINNRVDCIPYDRDGKIRGRKGSVDIFILKSVGGRS